MSSAKAKNKVIAAACKGEKYEILDMRAEQSNNQMVNHYIFIAFV